MIRLGKNVQLLEWGAGTNTLNQNWHEVARGKLRAQPKIKIGTTVIAVEVDGAFEKKNEKDDTIKVMQQGEGMTPGSSRWGEVAYGRLKSVSKSGPSTLVEIEINTAIKIGKTGKG